MRRSIASPPPFYRHGVPMPDSTHGSKRRCSVVTLGCKVNHYDSQVIRERALAAGYEAVDADAAADVVVVNTCVLIVGRWMMFSPMNRCGIMKPSG